MQFEILAEKWKIVGIKLISRAGDHVITRQVLKSAFPVYDLKPDERRGNIVLRRQRVLHPLDRRPLQLG